MADATNFSERQRIARAFDVTTLGAAFKAFDLAHAKAWQLDTASGYVESAAADRRTDEAWKVENAARAALMEILLPLAGIVPRAQAKPPATADGTNWDAQASLPVT